VRNKKDFLPNTAYRESPDISIYQALGRRPEQQDRYLASRLQDGYLLMVADGHSGTKTVSLIASRVTEIFSKERDALLRKQPESDSWGLPAAKERIAIRRTIHKLIRLTQREPSGSTITLAFLQFGTRPSDHQLLLRTHVGQMGDSVFAISSRPGTLAMSPLHSVAYNNKDVESIMRQYKEETGTGCRIGGNYIYSGLPGQGLALTRALGDHPFTLIRRPEVKTYEANPKDALILLASDGLFTPGVPFRPQLTGLFRQLREGVRLRELGNAIAHKHDNITMILVTFPEL